MKTKGGRGVKENLPDGVPPRRNDAYTVTNHRVSRPRHKDEFQVPMYSDGRCVVRPSRLESGLLCTVGLY